MPDDPSPPTHGPGTGPGSGSWRGPRRGHPADDEPTADAYDPSRAEQTDRGREAETPSQIPARGWRDILLRVKSEADQDNLSIIAAGVAYYLFLAIFPALGALVGVYGLVADPADVQRQVLGMAEFVPEGVRTVLDEQLGRLVQTSPRKLGLGVVIGLLVALWSANKGTGALLTALNITYDEQEKRGFLKRTALSLGFTFGAIGMGLVAIAGVVALPAVAGPLGLGGVVSDALSWLRWPLLGVLALVALSVLYRFGPSRDKAKWRWVTWGSALATAGWMAGSALLSLYVANFGSYDKTYGSVAAVVIAQLWLWLTAYVVLFGAELNCEIEHQTRRDSTEGPPKPMGKRGAYAADTVGASPP